MRKLRCIAFLLAAFTVFAQCPAMAEEELTVYVYENFEGGIVGRAPDGWFLGTSGTTLIRRIDKAHGKSGVMEFSTTVSPELSMRLSAPIKGDVIVDVDVYANNVIGRRPMFFLMDSSFRRMQLFMFSSRGWFTNYVTGQELFLCKPFRWYNFQLALSFEDRKIDLYCDGEKIVSDMPFPTAEFTDLLSVGFGQWDGMGHSFALDNFIMYGGNAIIEKSKLEDMMKVEYSDITGHWAENTIRTFINMGVLSKTEDGKYNPDGIMDRTEFFVLMNRTFKYTPLAYANPYIDVKASDWFANDLMPILQQGVMCGVGGQFRPNDPMLLSEAIEAAVEHYKYVTRKVPGEDTVKTPQELRALAEDYLRQARILDVTKGARGITLGEGDPEITRAQALTIIDNILSVLL